MDPVFFLVYLLVFAAAAGGSWDGIPAAPPPAPGGDASDERMEDGDDVGDHLDVDPEQTFDDEEFLEDGDGLGAISNPNDFMDELLDDNI